MEFKKVRACGFDKLYDGVMQYANNPNMKGFGDQLNEFLSHISVSYEIHDLSGMNVYYLNKICSSLIVEEVNYSSFSIKDELVDSERHLIKTAICAQMDEDTSKFNHENILPLGCVRYNVIATFKGAAIAFVTTYELDSIFRKQVNENDARGSLYESYPGNEIIEDKLAYMFYEKFFEYISNKMTSLDLVTEFMLENKFYKYADKMVNLAMVVTPFGSLDFFGADKALMKNQMNRLQSGYRTCDCKDKILSETYLQFVCKSSLGTFMKFALYYKKYLLDHENFKIVFSKSNYLFDSEILEKYHSRVEPYLQTINDYRNELKESTSINLNKFDYLLGADIIRYSISIPLLEVDNFVEESKKFGISFESIGVDVLKIAKMNLR